MKGKIRIAFEMEVEVDTEHYPNCNTLEEVCKYIEEDDSTYDLLSVYDFTCKAEIINE